MKNFKGRVAVVTGAAGGIGRATCVRLAERGCAIAAADIDANGLRSLEKALRDCGTKVSIHIVDVASSAAMAAFAREVERIHGAAHILVNNAGVVIAGTFEQQRLEDLEWLVGINYWGVVYGCHYFLPLLERQDEAHIVNLSSMFGFLGLPEQSGYCATKAAVRALSESLWAELRSKQIGVTSIHPGCINTSIVASGRIDDDDARRDVQSLFDRFGASPDIVAKAILRGIEKNKLRVRVRPESIVTEWVKRFAPVAIHHLIARRWNRANAQARRVDATRDKEIRV